MNSLPNRRRELDGGASKTPIARHINAAIIDGTLRQPGTTTPADSQFSSAPLPQSLVEPSAKQTR
ncbi:hypothetical protein [Nocardia sp. NPDC052112]|uniref:hypothetical protein n=1 Tax=Nocardia sp. NPDC052112 TaxID=3155646 RepID=UPI0034193B91